jgi:hypothetical protein
MNCKHMNWVHVQKDTEMEWPSDANS